MSTNPFVHYVRGSSGGVFSSVNFMASMILFTGSAMASLISSDETLTVLGSPVTRSRPYFHAIRSSFTGKADPTVNLTSSAVLRQ